MSIPEATSAAITYTAGWSAFQLGYHSTTLDVSAYDTFHFWVNGGTRWAIRPFGCQRSKWRFGRLVGFHNSSQHLDSDRCSVKFVACTASQLFDLFVESCPWQPGDLLPG